MNGNNKSSGTVVVRPPDEYVMLTFPVLDGHTVTRLRVPEEVQGLISDSGYTSEAQRIELTIGYSNRTLTLVNFVKYLFFVEKYEFQDIKDYFLKIFNRNHILINNWNNLEYMKTLCGVVKKNPEEFINSSTSKPATATAIITCFINYFLETK